MTRQALVVGINRYPKLKDSTNSFQHLTYASEDAEKMATLLRDSGNFRVKMLPDCYSEQGWNIDKKGLVRKNELEQEIINLFNPEDDDIPHTALLFFAGHGLSEQNNKKNVYLATSDVDNNDRYGISLEWLIQQLINSPVREQIVWLDCCYSGRFIELAEEYLNPKKANYFFIAACEKNQIAYAVENHGLLTLLLLRGLNPQQERPGEYINSKNLDAFIHDELSRDKKLKTFPQQFRTFTPRRNINFWQKLGMLYSTRLLYDSVVTQDTEIVVEPQQLPSPKLEPKQTILSEQSAPMKLTPEIPSPAAIKLEIPLPPATKVEIPTKEHKLILESEKGIDYAALRDLLAAGKWKEADEKTYHLVLKAANREEEGYLDSDNWLNFPCKDLCTIDQLWVQYSKGRFGFSIQKQILESVRENSVRENSVRENLDAYLKIWRKFGDKVGWRVRKWVVRVEWLEYDQLTFNPDQAPQGHLPFKGIGHSHWDYYPGMDRKMIEFDEYIDCYVYYGWIEYICKLFNRAEACNL